MTSTAPPIIPYAAPTVDGSLPVGHVAAPSPRFGYLPTLDGWRAIAIVLVLLAHAEDSLRRAFPKVVTGRPDFLEPYGWYGVQIFFALSGFLICARLLNERQTRGRINLRQFYGRRVFRILPASTAYLLVIAGLGFAGLVPCGPLDWTVTFACLSNYLRPTSWYLAHFWSLAIEEHFYLLWPSVLVMTGHWRRGLQVAVGLALAVAVWRFLDLKFLPPPGLYITFEARTDVQADGLLWGCILAFLYVEGSTRDRLSTCLRTPGWLVVLAVVLASTLWVPMDWKLRQVTLLAFRILAPVAIVGTVLHPTALVGRVLESAPLKIVGRYSYSIYLWQQLFLTMDKWRVPFLGPFQSFGWNLLGIAVCAWISHVCVEQPLIKLGHRITSSRKGPGSPPRPSSEMPVI